MSKKQYLLHQGRGVTHTGSGLAKLKADGLPEVNNTQRFQNKLDEFITITIIIIKPILIFQIAK